MGLEIQDQGSNNRVEVDADAIDGDLRIAIQGDGNHVRVGPGSSVSAGIDIVGNENTVIIGSRTRLLGDVPLEIQGDGNSLRVGDRCYGALVARFTSSGAGLEVGDGTTFQSVLMSLDEPKRITLGKDCLLAGAIWITVTDMHSIVDLDSGKRINSAKDVVIGDHVWLTMNVTVLKGARIGSGSIIGTGSVVAGEIPANSVAAGVPARVQRTNVTWKRDLIREEPHRSDERETDPTVTHAIRRL